jgi:phosphoglycolate phosphatase-like HAD superfamily hydrolase
VTAAAGRGPYELVVFDFDGTLCDSVHVKTEAFHRLYLHEHGPYFADRVLAHHLANQGVSRYDKIRHVEREFLGNAGDDRSVEVVAERFSRLVEDAVVAAPLLDGVDDYLKTTTATLAIASATPTAELQRIVARKGIDLYFVAVEGTPRAKADIVDDLVERLGVDRSRAVFVGDQPSDAAAATASGVDGVMIATPAPWNEAHTVVDSFGGAAQVLTGTR